MNEHEKINYVEFPARDIESTKSFFSTVLDGLLKTMGQIILLFPIKE